MMHLRQQFTFILTNSIFIIVQEQSRIPFPNLDPTVKYITQYNIKWNKRKNIKCTALNIRKKNSKHNTAEAAGERAVWRQWTNPVKANAVKMLWKLDNQCVKVSLFLLRVEQAFLKDSLFLKIRDFPVLWNFTHILIWKLCQPI